MLHILEKECRSSVIATSDRLYTIGLLLLTISYTLEQFCFEKFVLVTLITHLITNSKQEVEVI